MGTVTADRQSNVKPPLT